MFTPGEHAPAHGHVLCPHTTHNAQIHTHTRDTEFTDTPRETGGREIEEDLNCILMSMGCRFDDSVKSQVGACKQYFTKERKAETQASSHLLPSVSAMN